MVLIHLVLPKGQSKKVLCPCGRRVQHNSMPPHLKSKKHQAWMKCEVKPRTCLVESGSFYLTDNKGDDGGCAGGAS